MASKKQIHLFVAENLDVRLTQIAEELGATKSELLRQAIIDLIIKYEMLLGDGNVREKEKR